MKLFIFFALTVALASSAFAQLDYDPTQWAPVKEQFYPLNNPSGMTGTEQPGDGNTGRAKLLQWSWNIYPYPAVWIRPVQQAILNGLDPWYTVDVTVAGVPRSARWVRLAAMNVMTAGAGASATPAMFFLYRAGDRITSMYLNPLKYTQQIAGVRLSSGVLAPVLDGKFQFCWQQSPWPAPAFGAGGSTYSQHLFVESWAR